MKDFLPVIIGVLLASMLGYVSHVSTRLHNVEKIQAASVQHITVLGQHSKHLEDLENRTRMLEKK